MRAAIPLVFVLASCAPPPSGGARPREADAERGYAPPPALTAAARGPEGRVVLVGVAPPASRVRLGSPDGREIFAVADASGAWRTMLPASDGVRLYGLSAPQGGRTVQAEGYVAAAPDGEAARLRAGSGAVVFGRARPGAGLLAADFDRKGAAVLSGWAPAGRAVTLSVDGAARASVDSGPDGRFMLVLDKPLPAGAHVVEVASGAGGWRGDLDVSPPAPLAGGPFRAAQVADGWRVDWLTPGGGVQSTVIFAR
jgi:hypothetical protein